MLHRLIKRLQQLTAKLNSFIKWGLSKSTLIGVVFAIARLENQIDEIKQEEKVKTEKLEKETTTNAIKFFDNLEKPQQELISRNNRKELLQCARWSGLSLNKFKGVELQQAIAYLFNDLNK